MPSVFRSASQNGAKERFSQRKVARSLLWAGLLGCVFSLLLLTLMIVVDAGSVNLLTRGADSVTAAPGFVFDAGYCVVGACFFLPFLSVTALALKSRWIFQCHICLTIIFICGTITGGTILLTMFNGAAKPDSFIEERFEIWMGEYMDYLVELSQDAPVGWEKLQDRFDCCGADANSIVSFDPKFNVVERNIFLERLLSGEACAGLVTDASFLELVSNFNVSSEDEEFEEVLDDNGVDVLFCEDNLRDLLQQATVPIIVFMIFVTLGSLAGIVASSYLLRGTFFPRAQESIGRRLRKAVSIGTERNDEYGGPMHLLDLDGELNSSQSIARNRSLSPELRDIYSASFKKSTRTTFNEDTQVRMREIFAEEEAAAARKSLNLLEENAERNKPVKIHLEAPSLPPRPIGNVISPRRKSIDQYIEDLDRDDKDIAEDEETVSIVPYKLDPKGKQMTLTAPPPYAESMVDKKAEEYMNMDDITKENVEDDNPPPLPLRPGQVVDTDTGLQNQSREDDSGDETDANFF